MMQVQPMIVVDWARSVGMDDGGTALFVANHPGHVNMEHSVATGTGLVTNGNLGVDRIHVLAGQGFVPHTHPGDHILIVVAGLGTITYGGQVVPTEAGQLYMVPGLIPHAVGARTDHVILAVGSPHKAVDDPDRMAPIEYQAVTSTEVGDMTCLACGELNHGGTPIRATFPTLLHQLGCTHCPCFYCLSTGDAAEDGRLRDSLDHAIMTFAP